MIVPWLNASWAATRNASVAITPSSSATMLPRAQGDQRRDHGQQRRIEQEVQPARRRARAGSRAAPCRSPRPGSPGRTSARAARRGLASVRRHVAVAPTTTILPRTAAGSNRPRSTSAKLICRTVPGSPGIVDPRRLPAGSASLPWRYMRATATAKSGVLRARNCISRTGPSESGEARVARCRADALERLPAAEDVRRAVLVEVGGAEDDPRRVRAAAATASSASGVVAELGELDVVRDHPRAGLGELLDHLRVALAIEREPVLGSVASVFSSTPTITMSDGAARSPRRWKRASTLERSSCRARA